MNLTEPPQKNKPPQDSVKQEFHLTLTLIHCTLIKKVLTGLTFSFKIFSLKDFLGESNG